MIRDEKFMLRDKKFLIITGMHRSGTSWVAKAFYDAGLYLGDRLKAPSPFNPEGYFEDIDIIKFHDKVLSLNKIEWYGYRYGRHLGVPPALVEEAKKMIKSKFRVSKPIGWKDPRTCLFLEFWLKILSDVRWIFVFRNPAEVVWSLLRRRDFTKLTNSKLKQAILALRLWKYYNINIIKFYKLHSDDCLLVDINDDLLRCQELINKIVLDRWSFELKCIDLTRIYDPNLFHQVPLQWIRYVTKMDLTAFRLYRELKSLYRKQFDCKTGCRKNDRHKITRTDSFRSKKVICVAYPNKNAYSETFIRAHVHLLPADIKVLYGGWFPSFADNERPLLPDSFFHRAIRFAVVKILGVDAKWMKTQSLRHYFRKEKVGAVLAEYGPTGVNLMEVCRKEKIPLIVHFHGFDASDTRILEKYESAYREMFSLAAGVIAVSKEMVQRLISLGVPPSKLYLNPYGVDLQLFSGADPANTPPLFVAVGRFVDKKAPHLTILAFKKVVEQVPESRLVMVGDGNLLEACKQMTKALRIDHAVDFLGPKSHVEVAAILRRARAFVQHSLTTSYGDAEGTPVSILEASASGLPVVSTFHAGIKEVVIDNSTGFLVDEGDIDGMAQRMLRLANEPQLAAQMGRRARERIRSNYSMKKSIHRLWQIIEHCIEEYHKK